MVCRNTNSKYSGPFGDRIFGLVPEKREEIIFYFLHARVGAPYSMGLRLLGERKKIKTKERILNKNFCQISLYDFPASIIPNYVGRFEV